MELKEQVSQTVTNCHKLSHNLMEKKLFRLGQAKCGAQRAQREARAMGVQSSEGLAGRMGNRDAGERAWPVLAHKRAQANTTAKGGSGVKRNTDHRPADKHVTGTVHDGIRIQV
jgi:hypothetical protein